MGIKNMHISELDIHAECTHSMHTPTCTPLHPHTPTFPHPHTPTHTHYHTHLWYSSLEVPALGSDSGLAGYRLWVDETGQGEGRLTTVPCQQLQDVGGATLGPYLYREREATGRWEEETGKRGEETGRGDGEGKKTGQ